MSEFNMRVEERIAMWRREYVTVEAETLEEAIQKCIDGDYDIGDSPVYTNNPTTKCL